MRSTLGELPKTLNLDTMADDPSHPLPGLNLKQMFTPTVPPGTGTRRATDNRRRAEDWIPHRDFIIDRFIKQKQSLEFVLGGLSARGFDVTCAQLRHKLREWGEKQRLYLSTEDLEYLIRTLEAQKRNAKTCSLGVGVAKDPLRSYKRTLQRRGKKSASKQQGSESNSLPEGTEHISLRSGDHHSTSSNTQETVYKIATAPGVQQNAVGHNIQPGDIELMAKVRSYKLKVNYPPGKLKRGYDGHTLSLPPTPGSSSFALVPKKTARTNINPHLPPSVEMMGQQAGQIRADLLTSNNNYTPYQSHSQKIPTPVTLCLEDIRGVSTFQLSTAWPIAEGRPGHNIYLSHKLLDYGRLEAFAQIKSLNLTFRFDTSMRDGGIPELPSLNMHERIFFNRSYYASSTLTNTPVTNILARILTFQCSKFSHRELASCEKKNLEKAGCVSGRVLMTRVIQTLEQLVNASGIENDRPEDTVEYTATFTSCPCYSTAFTTEAAILEASRNRFHNMEAGSACVLKRIAVLSTCYISAEGQELQYSYLSLRCWVWIMAAKTLEIFSVLDSTSGVHGVSDSKDGLQDIFLSSNDNFGSTHLERLQNCILRWRPDEDIELFVCTIMALSYTLASQKNHHSAKSLLAAVNTYFEHIFFGVDFHDICFLIDENKLQQKMTSRHLFLEPQATPVLPKLVDKTEVLGRLYSNMFEWDRALEQFTNTMIRVYNPDAVSDEINNPKATDVRRIFRLVANVHKNSGNHHLAQRYYNACLEKTVDGGCGLPERSMIHYEIGDTLGRAGDHLGALKYLCLAIFVPGSDGAFSFSDESVLSMGFALWRNLACAGYYDHAPYWLEFTRRVREKVLESAHLSWMNQDFAPDFDKITDLTPPSGCYSTKDLLGENLPYDMGQQVLSKLIGLSQENRY